MERITSPNNPRLKSALRLHTARGRQKQNRIIVFGIREISRAVQAGVQFREIFVDASAALSGQVAELQRSLGQGTCFLAIDSPLFRKLTFGQRTDELIGIAERPATDLGKLNVPEISTVLVLESLEKPGNLGAISRTADAAGRTALLLADPRTDVFHPNAIRASVATVFSVPLACGSSAEISDWLNQHDFEVLAMTPEATQTIFEIHLPRRTAFVLGSEARGLTDIWKLGRRQAKLPMAGIADSLNVSVTAALLMFEAYRQRESKST